LFFIIPSILLYVTHLFTKILIITNIYYKFKYLVPVITKEFTYARFFHEGLVAVHLNFTWGFIDESGKEIIPFKYEEVWDFSEGISEVTSSGKNGVIYKSVKEIVPLEFDNYLWF